MVAVAREVYTRVRINRQEGAPRTPSARRHGQEHAQPVFQAGRGAQPSRGAADDRRGVRADHPRALGKGLAHHQALDIRSAFGDALDMGR